MKTRTKDSREFSDLIKHIQRKWRRIIEYMKEGGKAAKCISDRNACAQKNLRMACFITMK